MDVFSADADISAALQIDFYETGQYGNKFGDSVEPDGRVDFSFGRSPTELTLYVTGYDIDFTQEVAILVNDQLVGYLSASDEEFALTDTKIVLSASLFDGSDNTLTFRQTGSAQRTWGVTEILLLGDGPHDTLIDIDPEFTDDGYVVWQTDEDFFLGRIDLETGVFLGVINQAGFVPTPITETLQGPEILATQEDGVGGIGMTDQGIVYFNRTESYLLDGTEGFRFGLTPKGETPGLRFTIADENRESYLYDNGVITKLDLDGGLASSWFDASSFYVSYYKTGLSQIMTYDVETGDLDLIARREYGGPGQQAAFTADDGTRYGIFERRGSHDIWAEIDGTWQAVKRISSPFEEGSKFYSPEFFEWQGRIWLSGYVANSVASESFAVLYDMEADTWALPVRQGGVIDPEVVVLDTGGIAMYYTLLASGAEKFDLFTASEADALMVGGESVLPPKSPRFGGQAASTDIDHAPAITLAEAGPTARIGTALERVEASAGRIARAETPAETAALPGGEPDHFEFDFGPAEMRRSDRGERGATAFPALEVAFGLN